MTAFEDNHQKRPATLRVCPRRNFDGWPLQYQGFQRENFSKFAKISLQLRKSG